MKGSEQVIRSLYIDNFKALNDFSIEMKPLTVLIGTNGSGKTSILQALDFMCNFARMDLEAYLDRRNWKASELKSKMNKKLHMTFKAEFLLEVNDCKKLVEWTFVLNPIITKGKVQVISEEIVDKTSDKKLLSVNSQGISRFNFQDNNEEKFPPLNMTSSFLKNINVQKDKAKFPELVALTTFLTTSDSFELLSTEKMRRSSRGEVDTIGMGGEKLAAFIHGLQNQQKKNISERLHKYVPFINTVDAEVKGRPGWIEIKVSEVFPAVERYFTINPGHVSDGTMRLMAFAALMEIDKSSGMIMLDEIEDGINPHIADKVVEDLMDLVKIKHRQVVVTTHSSVMLDYFPQESIIFLWRSRDGAIHSDDLFSKPDIRDRLEHMYPGEVWLNMDEEEIIGRLMGDD